MDKDILLVGIAPSNIAHTAGGYFTVLSWPQYYYTFVAIIDYANAFVHENLDLFQALHHYT